MERLELPRVSPLEPKSSASTNSATFAVNVNQYSAIRATARSTESGDNKGNEYDKVR